jgi:hypothetical protein
MRSLLVYCIAFVIYTTATFTYHFLFHPDTSEPYFASVGGTLFVRTYLPDSSLYEHIYGISDLTIDDLHANITDEGTNENIIGISILAALWRDVGIEPVYFNVLLVALAGLILLSVCNDFGIASTSPLIVLFLSPSTVYYSQTATKEIVTIFLTTLFVLVIATARGTWRVIGASLVIVLASAFRVQNAIPMAFAFLTSYASVARKRRALLGAFIGLSLILPLLYGSGVLDPGSMMQYRIDAPSSTKLADYIDAALQNVPLAGVLLLPIRAFQNVTEPFPVVEFTEIERGVSCISIYAIVLVLTVTMTWFFTCEFTRVLWRMIAKRSSRERRVDTIVTYGASYWLMVAANPFVHARYMFCMLPVFALIAATNRKYFAIERASSAEYPEAELEKWSTAPSRAAWTTIMLIWSARFAFQLWLS